MKLLRRKEGPSLDSRLAGLLEAAELAEGRLPEEVVAGARAVSERAGVRRGLSLDHTVAALAGATGSGKSSLYNALAGHALAAVGVTRPTTSAAQAAVWDGEGAGPLLDWLEIPRRHSATAGPSGPNSAGPGRSDLTGTPALGERIDLAEPPGAGGPPGPAGASRVAGAAGAAVRGGPSELAGLVLLDLPDHDSIELSHRLEVDRLVELVDLLVWVVDPQKYADAALHERYLRPLAAHRDVMLLVLNQVDRLPSHAVDRCVRDLGRLLEDDGLADVPVLAVSARTGTGLPELRRHLADRVADRRSWSARLTADIATAAARLGDPTPPPENPSTAGALTDALARAAGVPAVVEAVARGHRHRAVVATGWPVTRWMRRFRPDPIRRLRLGAVAAGGRPEIVGRTSVPAASVMQRAQVETAIRDVGEKAAAGLPGPWAAAVRQAARSRSADLADAVDRAVGVTSAGATRRPRWWRAVNVLQWLVFAAMAAGALWLGGLFAMDYLRLPQPPLPTAGPLPWPTALLIGGALAGVLVALLSRLAAWAGGRRRARRASKALRAAIGQVGKEHVLDPVATELDRYARFTEALKLARA
ncbi:MAG TPA: ABC transporter [Nonomuraea sp.]|nr:ABC transporter [Nonomuraea sp.]